MDKKKLIGLRIKTMRKSRRMTQRDLAASLGQSQASITMYETGRREPDLDTLEALADIFNVSLYSLVSDDMLPMESKILPPDDQAFLSSYRSLSPAGKDYLQQQLKVARVMFQETADRFNKEE